MLGLNNAGIEPGDILFAVGHNDRSWLTRFKQLVQSIPTEQRKHGHREVTSVFVCTGENKAGKLFYNHEQHIKKSRRQMMAELREMSVLGLKEVLFDLCMSDDHDLMKKVLPLYGDQGREIADSMVDTPPPASLYTSIINAVTSRTIQVVPPQQPGFFRRIWQSIFSYFRKNELKKTDQEQAVLADFLGKCWSLSDKSQVLLGVSHSLLVFKHNHPGQREAFLQLYQKQVAITEEYHAKNRKRTDFGKLFLAMFQSAKQDSYDKNHHEPARDTYCARNIIEVLNQMDSNLVDRGRHVLPKELEAGMRAATQRKLDDPSVVTHDAKGEIDWETLDKLEPPFTMMILPESGRELMTHLMDVIFAEAARLSKKKNQTEKEKNKLVQIEAIIAPYRDINHPVYSYTLHSQVEIALRLLATLLPVLAIQTGFENPLKSRSYRAVRAFARTQGIFDGDIREKAAMLQAEALKAREQGPHEQAVSKANAAVQRKPNLPSTGKVFLLTDWSFHGWSDEKQQMLVAHFKQLINDGHAFYIWQHGQLLVLDSAGLDAALIPPRYFDVAEGLTPSLRQAVMAQAKTQGIDEQAISLLDYSRCEELSGRASNLDQVIVRSGEFFAESLTPQHIREKTGDLIHSELENAPPDTPYYADLLALQIKVFSAPAMASIYKSGVDTKTNFRSRVLPAPIFTAIKKGDVPPFVSYERREVYTSLTLLENAESNHEFFELQGNVADDATLKLCQFEFHSTKFEKGFMESLARENTVYFRARKSLSLTQHWQALPSCCAEEELTHLCIQGGNKCDFEIKKSSENGLYYIRKTSASSTRDVVTVDYLLKMPPHYRAMPVLNMISLWQLHCSIAELIVKYYGFSADHAQLTAANHSTNGQDYLALARQLKAGSCRLRAIAFKEEMAREHPEVPVNIIVNDVHCYIEMKLDDVWQSYCLGGGDHFILQHIARPVLTSVASCQVKTLFSTGKVDNLQRQTEDEPSLCYAK